MKAKPILIIFGILVLVTVVALIVRGRMTSKPEKSEIVQFLKQFDKNLQAGNTDSLNSYFESNQHGKIMTKLFNILSNKTAADGKSDPLFKMALGIDKTQITVLNNELVQATIPVTFAHDKISSQQTFLVLKIHQLNQHHYRIIQLDARRLLADLVVYEKKIKMIGMSDKDLYSALTLASFKIAKSLVPKYDSVIWFQHIGGKTWYFVAKGKYKQYNYDDSAKQANPYKIGLVNPDLKEIIPPKYDLVHNINGTIDGLIEVEDGDKKGFFDINGKNIVPAEYDQAFALTDSTYLALLVKGDNYFYLKKDLTISDKVSGLKISDEIKKVKNFGSSFKLEDSGSDDLMEYNNREEYNSLIVSPSYMVELGILPKFLDLPNHLRKVIANSEDDDAEGEGSEFYKVTFDGHKAEDNNWFESAYYSIVDNFLGGRAGLYQSKDMLVIDKKKNKIFTYTPDAYIPNRDGGGELTGLCNDNALRQLNDTLFELKTTAIVGVPLNGVQINEFPHYSYLHFVKGKLAALLTTRYFGFTEFVKMDDSYLEGCYVINGKRTDHLSPEVLQYMKNEIFASYGLRFKTEKWAKEFEYNFGYDDKTRHDNVNDSLTAIDKYNINWLSQKLNGAQNNTQLAK